MPSVMADFWLARERKCVIGTDMKISHPSSPLRVITAAQSPNSRSDPIGEKFPLWESANLIPVCKLTKLGRLCRALPHPLARRCPNCTEKRHMRLPRLGRDPHKQRWITPPYRKLVKDRVSRACERAKRRVSCGLDVPRR